MTRRITRPTTSVSYIDFGVSVGQALRQHHLGAGRDGSRSTRLTPHLALLTPQTHMPSTILPTYSEFVQLRGPVKADHFHQQLQQVHGSLALCNVTLHNWVLSANRPITQGRTRSTLLQTPRNASSSSQPLPSLPTCGAGHGLGRTCSVVAAVVVYCDEDHSS